MKFTWEKTQEDTGILVAFDGSMQFLLFWWFLSLRNFSSLPIAFVSLGQINENIKNFCKKNGYFFDIEKYVNDFKKIKIPKKYKEKYKEKIQGDVVSIRPYWFAKPIAMMHTPFEKTLYLDIDCEVKDSIDELFVSLNENEISLCKDISEFVYFNDLDHEDIIYNSGVILYKKKAKIIEKWADLSLKFSHEFLGDQDLLSHIINKDNYKISNLPLCFNCHKVLENRTKVKILHWGGGASKIQLIEKIKNDSYLRNTIENILNGNHIL